MTGLREKLFNTLTNWVVNSEDDNLEIIQKYKDKLRLFELTAPFEKDEVMTITFLPPKLMVSSVIKSLEIVKTELHAELVCWTRAHKRTPRDLDELDDAISESNNTILRLGTIRIKKPKNPVTQPIVNAINTNNSLNEFKSNNQLFSSINDSNNASSNSNSNVNDNSNKFNNQSQSFQNANYSQNRGRGRGRGYRSYRGNGTRGQGRNRGRGNGSRSNFNGFVTTGVRRFNNGIPRFLPDYCNDCKKFGHYARDCKYLHNRAPDLLNAYMKRERAGQKKNKNDK